MPDLPLARVCHVTPNRLRLRIPDRRHDEAFFDTVRSRVSEWDSIERVEVNPTTASVLVFYADLAALFLENATRNDLFELAPIDAEAVTGPETLNGSSLADSARQGIEGLGQGFRRLNGGQDDLRSLVLLGLLGTGVVQLFRGNVMAPAMTLFWYAGDLMGIWSGGSRTAPETGTDRRV